MSDWYLVIGFNDEVELKCYKDEMRAWKKQVSPTSVSQKSLSGEELGVHLLDLRNMDDFDLSDNEDIEVFPYYVFWKLETGFSVGFGFFGKEDMEKEQDE